LAASKVASLASLPRPIWALVAGTFLNRFGGFVFVFLVLYLTRKGYSPAQAGLAVAAYGIGSVAASAAGGYLADRLGRRGTILLSMCGSAAAMLALSQAGTLPLIALLTMLAGLCSELYRPASSALLADLLSPEQRITGFALYRLAINAGTTLGPALAGVLVARSYFLLFAGDALTSLLFALVALVALPGGAIACAPPAQSPPLLTALRADRRFVLFLAAALAGSFVYMQAFSTLSLQVRADGYAPVAYGALLSLNGLLIIACELPLTAITRRWPVHLALALGALLSGLGFALTTFAAAFPLLLVSVGVWTLGEMVQSPIAGAYVADVSPPHLRGQYAGVYGLVWSLGLILAPALGTQLFAWNPSSLWLICGLLGGGAALLIVLTQRPIGAPRSGAALSARSTRRTMGPRHCASSPLRRRRSWR
jgi:MFS family permease